MHMGEVCTLVGSGSPRVLIILVLFIGKWFMLVKTLPGILASLIAIILAGPLYCLAGNEALTLRESCLVIVHGCYILLDNFLTDIIYTTRIIGQRSSVLKMCLL